MVTRNGKLRRPGDGREFGVAPCALVARHGPAGPMIHGTCIVRLAPEGPPELGSAQSLDLVLDDGRIVPVRVVKHTSSDCGPEIVRFEGPGRL